MPGGKVDDNHGLENSLKKIMKTLDLQMLVPMPCGRVDDYSWA